MSVATGGAVLGTAALVSGAASAAGSPSASAAVATPAAAPVESPGASLVLPGAFPVAAGSAAATIPAATIPAATIPAATIPAATIPAATIPAATIPAARTSPDTGPSNQPSTAAGQVGPSALAAASAGSVPGSAPNEASGASVSPRPFDPHAAAAGLSGPYRFVAHLNGLSGLMELGGVVEGVVTDPAHFVLEFPESTFITRYTRDGATARAVVNGQTVIAQPGMETAGAISPEDMLPGGILAQTIAPWEGTLHPDSTGDGYAANPGVLISAAKEQGILATNWQLSAKTDASGRLTTLAFSGISWDQAFALDLVILYG